MPSGHRQPKGRYVPRRGHAVLVSPTEVLLSVSSPYDIKRPTHGLPRPLAAQAAPSVADDHLASSVRVTTSSLDVSGM
jgi:hypothetical protein